MTMLTWPNKITRAKGGGPSQLQAARRVAAVAQFRR
jgi:hypothetical protein